MDTKLAFFNTIKILNEGGYRGTDGKYISVDIDSMLDNTQLYSKPIHIESCGNHNAIIQVENVDTFVKAQQLFGEGYNVVVLNMCSDEHIGGLVVYCAEAQEETLVCRSSLIKSLYKFARDPDKINPYNIVCYLDNTFDKNYGAIYSPNVTVFRNESFELLNKPFQIAVISMPALRHPTLVDSESLSLDDYNVTKNKIRTVLNAAIKNGHDAIVLGAWGCGAYGNPPVCVSSAFKDVLQERLYKSSFRYISFAILGNQTYGIFSKKLQYKQL